MSLASIIISVPSVKLSFFVSDGVQNGDRCKRERDARKEGRKQKEGGEKLASFYPR